jgi:hypothetical protein
LILPQSFNNQKNSEGNDGNEGGPDTYRGHIESAGSVIGIRNQKLLAGTHDYECTDNCFPVYHGSKFLPLCHIVAGL